MQLEQLFTDREKEALNRFINDETMKEAVKKVILSSIYFDGTIKTGGIPDPLTNFCLAQAALMQNQSNKKLGAMMKANLAAVQLLENGFIKLNRFNKKKERENKGRNPAR